MQNDRMKTQDWRNVKAKITVRFGTITACARHLKCSDEAIRQAVNGKCPGVATKLEKALA